MLLVLVGIVVIAIPIALAARTVMRLLRELGGVDGVLVGNYLRRHADADLEALAASLASGAPRSVASRLVHASLDDSAGRSLVARELTLAEAVSDVERDVINDLRVPRVAASLATTGGLLAASLVMREGLGAAALSDNGADAAGRFQSVIERGLTLAAVAVFGGIVCVALHRVAQRLRKSRIEELDALTPPLRARIVTEATPRSLCE